MRSATAAVLLAIALPALAQTGARPIPPGSVPLDDPPQPPPLSQHDAPEPEVTTRHNGDDVIQEYRIHGKLYMQRVTPKHGHPYVLMDNRGDGTFTREDSFDTHVRVPQWVLFEF
ncbi:MAG TPA: DUF2782 domain-containing protein [Usitatibacter sp.]|jgi:hypothetical protein|nr:DUF2782 domain-containing protein [Usitatibacter sp.]